MAGMPPPFIKCKILKILFKKLLNKFSYKIGAISYMEYFVNKQVLEGIWVKIGPNYYKSKDGKEEIRLY